MAQLSNRERLAGRPKLRSPGRPPVGRREDRQRFWAAIARGCYPEAAVRDARVSWVVGARWFRQAGGMPPTHLELFWHAHLVFAGAKRPGDAVAEFASASADLAKDGLTKAFDGLKFTHT